MPHVVPPAAQTPIGITDDRARLDLTRILEISNTPIEMAMMLRR
jgi:hypothetical protein